MKQIIHNTNAKQLIAFITLIIISLVIWFDGPLLLINHQYPLQQPEKRFYIIAFLFLVWTLTLIFSSSEKKTRPTPKNPDIQKKLHILNGRFQGAFRFLKKTVIKKQGKNINLSHLPWYLLIGPSNAGKTSLLANATINFMLTKQFKQDKLTPSDSCDWWATRDLVLIDVPGSYFTEKYHILWESFLHLIKRYRKSPSIHATVVALPFPELIKPQHAQQKKQISEDIKQKIEQLRMQFGNQLQFYFVITKCDQLPGFTEFFSEFSAEELAQAWGVTLPTPKQHEHLHTLFIQRFNALIKRLNTQLIWRLHQERNPNSRPSIKDLPLHMERLKEAMSDFLNLLSLPDLCLQGVYLSSALQSPTEEQASSTRTLSSPTHQPLQLLNIPAVPSKPYFIRQFILQGLLNTTESQPTQPIPTTPAQRWQRRATYAASVATIITAAILLGRDFQQSMLQTYAIYNDLTQYQFAIQQPGQEGDHLLKALPLLNALQSATTYKNNHLSHYTNILSFYSNKSQQTANTVYQQALQKIVLPAIKNDFENYLQASSNKNPVQLYAVLKAYLMLGSQQNLQADYIVSILKQLLPTSLTKQAYDDLISHMRVAASSQVLQSLSLNQDLINETRNRLRHLSNAELGLVLLKNIGENNTNSAINLETTLGSSPVFVNNQNTNPIPNMYTVNAFNRIYSEDIPTVATETLRGNWVIGNMDSLPNEAMLNALIQQIQSQYVTNYVNTWENIITTLKLVTPTNLAQTDAMIATLTSNTSPLLQLLQTIKQNTSFATVLTASPKIQALNNLLVNAHNDQANPLYQIFISLRQLDSYLQNISNNTDIGLAAFEAAKQRSEATSSDPIAQIHQLAEQNPEPLKSWLHHLAAKSWYFILHEAGQHIEDAWQVNIMTIYKSQLTTQEIDLQQFSNFVGKQGTFAIFYQHYLKPFVNETGQWQWRVIDNQTLPFANTIPVRIQQTTKFQNISKYVLFSQGRKYLAQHRFQLPTTLISAAPIAVANDD